MIKEAYLLDSLQTSESVLGFGSWEESTISSSGYETDEDNDVQTGFHFKISFE